MQGDVLRPGWAFWKDAGGGRTEDCRLEWGVGGPPGEDRRSREEGVAHPAKAGSRDWGGRLPRLWAPPHKGPGTPGSLASNPVAGIQVQMRPRSPHRPQVFKIQQLRMDRREWKKMTKPSGVLGSDG